MLGLNKNNLCFVNVCHVTHRSVGVVFQIVVLHTTQYFDAKLCDFYQNNRSLCWICASTFVKMMIIMITSLF